MIIPRHYEDLNVLHENTMPNRAYYIPASGPLKGDETDRMTSDRVQLLSGTWKFRYYASVYDAQEPFYEEGYDVSVFDEIPVPGVWQNFGYDAHQYTNTRYPFPMDPPYVPQENPCGAYVRTFTYRKDEAAPRAYLNFEGVDSCFYVWLNGRYIGYSQVSHSTSEFDVTEAVREGENRLAVLVLKWCDGSYLEDQDKFRMSGIFRDVYLLKRPAQGISDYFVKTKTDGSVEIRFKFRGQDTFVHVQILDAHGRVVREKTSNSGTQLRLQLDRIHLWSAERPYLYTVIYETDEEFITDRLGFREITVEENVVKINGMPVKFHGVNRHDSDPVTGFAICTEQMKKDLTLMKQHNVNAIRTSHYPNAPQFYQLCDACGFFLIDESDIEAHGAADIYMSSTDWEERRRRWNRPIAENPAWTESIVDRVQRCVERDKNRPSVVIWSMGNESAYGCTFEAALAWTKGFDPTRLTHYESAMHTAADRKYDYSNLDLYSRMYPSLKEIDDYIAADPDKPFVMCEYCHAMGNGPGDLEDYFAVIQKYDGVCGAFVWEWCDHAVYKGRTKEGKKIYFYGGDHGEYLHDGNFCMDGLVYPDRRPHTGLLEFKNVHRPARVVRYEQETGEMVLHNYMDFTDLGRMSIAWEVSRDGETVRSGTADIPAIAPHAEGTVSLKVDVPADGKCFLKVSYVLEGRVQGFDELPLANADGRNRKVLALLAGAESAGEIAVTEDDRFLFLRHPSFSYTVSKLTGMFTDMVCGQKQLLTRPAEINIWRAPTDNDRNIKNAWLRAHYDRAYARAYGISWERAGEAVVIRSTLSMAADSVQRMLDIQAEYRVFPDGRVEVKMDVKRDIEFPELPRFGLRLFLPRKMDTVSYCGIGPQESYEDKRRAGSHGLYRARVQDLHEDYLRPQENGSHADCDYVTVESRHTALSAAGESTFSFNASVYTQEELTQKAHSYELKPCGSTVLCLDYRQNGIGSNSCGPRMLPQYRLEEEQFMFAVTLVPQIR